jgi:uncharacterized membrane protein YjjP (DUF1212 family)
MSFLFSSLGWGMIGLGIMGLLDDGKGLNIILAFGLGCIIVLLAEIKDNICKSVDEEF